MGYTFRWSKKKDFIIHTVFLISGIMVYVIGIIWIAWNNGFSLDSKVATFGFFMFLCCTIIFGYIIKMEYDIAYKKKDKK